MISIISPVYNSEKCLKKLVEKISFYTKKITNKFEIILVDDGSNDESWKMINHLKKQNTFLKAIKLSKNYGQHYAIFQGIKSSKEELIIVMDCDLQDNPAYIVEMVRTYKKVKKPIIIEHSYKNFKFSERFISNIFWYFLSAISLRKFSPNLGNYLLINKKIKKKYLSLEKVGYLYGDLILQGNNFVHIKKTRSLGVRDKSTYNLTKLISLGMKLILKYNFISANFIFSKKKKIKILVEKNI